VVLLARHFIRRYAEENNRNVSDELDREVAAALEAYHWPGNVRELENAIERAVIITRSDRLTLDDLREEIVYPERFARRDSLAAATGAIDVAQGISFYEEVNRFQIELIKRALEITGGHQSRAARLLGMNTTTLNSKIKYFGIR
jgi:DNA-binding NtrC family response regulator